MKNEPEKKPIIVRVRATGEMGEIIEPLTVVIPEVVFTVEFKETGKIRKYKYEEVETVN
jgi:hypothetical protein